jgi:hypothetical protein
LHEAEVTVAAGGFDCAIIDMNWRGSVAHTVADQLEHRGVPFLIATGYDRASLTESLQHAPRVEKPFAPA